MATESDLQTLGEAAYGTARVSPQRLAIAAAVEASARHAFSADDIATEVRRGSPSTGLATVYRAVAVMQSTGFIEAVGERGGAILYARCGRQGHHHHLVCTSCSAVEDIECPIWIDGRTDSNSFRVTGHSLVLQGLCPRCQQRPGVDGLRDALLSRSLQIANRRGSWETRTVIRSAVSTGVALG